MVCKDKTGKKWVIEGEGEGWISNIKFPTKWKAQAALEIFKKGGSKKDYWREREKWRPPEREPYKVHEIVKRLLDEMCKVGFTEEDIVDFAKNHAVYGEVTNANSERGFGPNIHNTWGIKQGGRVHIDLGAEGYHLMLDKNGAKHFIDYLNQKGGEH